MQQEIDGRPRKAQGQHKDTTWSLEPNHQKGMLWWSSSCDIDMKFEEEKNNSAGA